MYNHVIVVSGQPGAGSSTVALNLAEAFSIPCFIAGRLFKDIALGTLHKQPYYKQFKQLCAQKNINLPRLNAGNDEEAARAVWNSPVGTSLAFHEAIDDLQRKLAKEDNIIIEGKLAVHLISEATLRVWLTASFSTRVERHALKNKISLKEASRFLEMRQEQERAEWQRLYGFDYWEQDLEADIVLDTSNINPKEAVKQIIEAFSKRQSQSLKYT